jgi:hypothetical protein
MCPLPEQPIVGHFKIVSLSANTGGNKNIFKLVFYQIFIFQKKLKSFSTYILFGIYPFLGNPKYFKSIQKFVEKNKGKEEEKL